MKCPPSLKTTIAELALGFLALLSLSAPPSAWAQTTYNTALDNNITNIYGSIFPNTSPHYDAINFATGNGAMLDVDQDVSFTGGTLAKVFTSTTFTSTGGRVAASMLGIFVIPGLYVAFQTFRETIKGIGKKKPVA